VIFGLIDSEHLQILYVEKKEEIGELNDRVSSMIDKLEKPFYAFNLSFERAF